MRLGSLFAGVGGFDEGFRRAGVPTAWWVENDKHCRQLLKARFPGVPGFGDITKIHHLPQAEVWAGGSPCVDVSIAGRRAGLTGKASARRSGLFFNFMALVALSRPQWVVIENVPGLLSSNKGRDMGTVLGTLDELGYGWAYRVLDASYFGVPQRRRRVFIVGCADRGYRRAAEVLFERESRRWDSRKGGKKKAEVAGAVTRRLGTGGADDNGARVGHLPHRVAATLQGGGLRGYRIDAEAAAGGYLQPIVFDTTQITSPGNYSSPKPGNLSHPLAAGAHPPAIAFSTKDYGADAGELAPTLRSMNYDKSHPNGGGQMGVVTSIEFSLASDPNNWIEDGVPPITVASGDRGNVAKVLPHDGYAVRRLLPVECERLQGFPDDWTEGFADSVRFRMLGNAVCVVVAEWIARRLVAVDEGRDPDAGQ